MRLFLAVDVPDHVREVVSRLQQDLISVCDDRITWVEPSLFHVTLVFLGNVAEDVIPACYADLRELAANSVPLEFRARDFVAFPSWRQPRVVGVELHDIGDRARVLRGQLMTLFKKHAITVQETAWRPHITLGRVKGANSTGFTPPRSFEAFSWSASHIAIKQSVLSQRGPTYNTRITFSLATHV